MPQEGLLVQADASPFEWLEDGGPRCSLHGFIDDATSKIVGLYTRPTEDLRGYLELLKQAVTCYGVPQGIYSDGHTIFFSPKKDKLTIEQELAGAQVALTQFGKALDEMGITHIHARSPEAKGRIERLWETLQGRLLIELRIANISTIEGVNTFLPSFIAKFNKRFAVEPANPETRRSTCPPMYRQLPYYASCLESWTTTGKTEIVSMQFAEPLGEHHIVVVLTMGPVFGLPSRRQCEPVGSGGCLVQR